MDIDRARTFLEIVRSGTFLRAAERLHVTQTTVSARIRTLEEELGRQLFVRNRNGARLTTAGVEFERYAQMFVQVWERARQQLAVPADRTGVVSLGAELSLWNPLLVDWMAGMKERDRSVLVHARVGTPDRLVDELRTGSVDVALVYAPPLIAGFKVELLMEEQLVLVRSVPEGLAGGDDDYVYVDWGPAFAAQHGGPSRVLGDPTTFAGFGPLGLAYILRAGGSGYFRRGMVTPLIETGRLELVEDAPCFTHPAYAVYGDEAEQRPEIHSALTILRSVLKEQ